MTIRDVLIRKREKALQQYVKERHNQDECIGFIDGYEKAIRDVKAEVIIDLLECVSDQLLLGLPVGKLTHNMIKGKLEIILEKSY